MAFDFAKASRIATAPDTSKLTLEQKRALPQPVLKAVYEKQQPKAATLSTYTPPPAKINHDKLSKNVQAVLGKGYTIDQIKELAGEVSSVASADQKSALDAVIKKAEGSQIGFLGRVQKGASEGFQRGVKSFEGAVESYEQGKMGLPNLVGRTLAAGAIGAGGAVLGGAYEGAVAPFVPPEAGKRAFQYVTEEMGTPEEQALGKMRRAKASQGIGEFIAKQDPETVKNVAAYSEAAGSVLPLAQGVKLAAKTVPGLIGKGLEVTGAKTIINKAVTTGREKLSKSLISEASGLTPTAKSKLSEKAVKAGFKDVEDFYLQNNIRGDRDEMADKLENLFKTITKKAKPEIIKNATGTVPNTHKDLLEVLEKKYDTLGQEDKLARIRALKNKSELTANDLEYIRLRGDKSLPKGAYGDQTPVATEGFQNKLDDVRKGLAGLDKTGTLGRQNKTIQLLHDLIPKAKVAGKEGKAATFIKGMQATGRIGTTLGATALNPLAGLAAGAFNLAAFIKESPSMASYFANLIKVKKLPANTVKIIKKALKEIPNEN